jgi:uncharacterized membrane protein (DUF485 family)
MPAQQPNLIRQSKSFTELERQRTAFSWTLTVIMLGIYFAFIYLVAFDKELLATPISGVITLGFPMGVCVILSAIVLTGIYVLRANTQFDRLTEKVRGDVRNENLRGGVR